MLRCQSLVPLPLPNHKINLIIISLNGVQIVFGWSFAPRVVVNDKYEEMFFNGQTRMVKSNRSNIIIIKKG